MEVRGMVKVNHKYLEEITKHYRAAADREIMGLGENPDSEQVKEIEQKFGSQAVNNVAYILSLPPKKIFKMNLAVDPSGWRAGYTKPTLEKRKQERRKKNKAARIARRSNNRRSK